MSYKNSFKLLTTNFDLVWKQLLYTLIVSLLTFGFGYWILVPTINLLKEQGVINEIANIFETLYTSPNEIAMAISTTANHFIDCIAINFENIWASVIGFFFMVIFVFRFLINMSTYNLTSLMHLKMTSFVSVSYTRNFITNIKQSFKYSLAKCVLSIPFIVSKILILTLYFKLSNSIFGIIFGLFLISLLLIIINSIEKTLHIGFAPNMIETPLKAKPFKSFFAGNKIIFKRFFRNFSNTILLVISVLFINTFLGIFTIGAGLLITIPASMVIFAIFNLACYFASKGDKYYLNETAIIVPVNKDNSKLN